MNGSAGSSRPRNQKHALIGSSGAVPTSKRENGDPVAGLAARIVEAGTSARSRARSPIRLPRQLLWGATLIRDGKWRLMPFAETNTIPVTFDQAGMHQLGVGAPGETVGRIWSCSEQ